MLHHFLSPLLLLAFEEVPPETTEEAPSMLPLMLAIGAIFWFVMILPERKNRKKREELLSQLKKGDKVMMKSGLYGSIAQVQEDVVTLQVSDGVRMKFAREAIQSLVEEPSSKDEPAKS
jgi:preprotein translocase subunit YajC